MASGGLTKVLGDYFASKKKNIFFYQKYIGDERYALR